MKFAPVNRKLILLFRACREISCKAAILYNVQAILVTNYYSLITQETDNIELLNHQVVTKRDLLNFGNLLLSEIKNSKTTETPTKQWLKSAEVRELLKISPGTLQNLRINGTLKYKRIGGIIYYNYEDIIKMLEK